MMKFLKRMNESHWIMTSIMLLLIGFIFGIVLGIGIVKTPTVEVVTPSVVDSTSVQKEVETGEILVEPSMTPEAEEKGKAMRQAEISVNSGAGWSKKGLKSFLITSYNFSADSAQYAVDNIEVDWNEEAYEKLRSYMGLNPDWETDRFIEQLEFEKFEDSEIEYALEKAGLKKAE